MTAGHLHLAAYKCMLGAKCAITMEKTERGRIQGSQIWARRLDSHLISLDQKQSRNTLAVNGPKAAGLLRLYSQSTQWWLRAWLLRDPKE